MLTLNSELKRKITPGQYQYKQNDEKTIWRVWPSQVLRFTQPIERTGVETTQTEVKGYRLRCLKCQLYTVATTQGVGAAAFVF